MTDRGPADHYEVTWRSGHVDRLNAHQVSWQGGPSFLSGISGGPSRILFHAEIEGRWTLMLSVLEDDILSVRNVTQVPEHFDFGERSHG